MDDGPRNTEQPMEPTTPFDLNQAIQRWREDLGQSPAFRSENLFELESHLRDSVATLQRQGLSDEEALLVATKRLGTAASLESEFAKRNVQLVWLDRALWVLVGVQLWGLATGISHVFRILTTAVLPGINSWLSTYGFSQISVGAIPQIVQAITLPIILLSGAKLVMGLNHRLQKNGKSPVVYFQQRPRMLAAIFAFLSILPWVITYCGSYLVSVYGPQRIYGAGYSVGWAYGAQGLHIVIFSALVLVLARKRLRLRLN